MYDSNVSDEEWELIKHLDPLNNRGGSGTKHAKRTIVNTIFNLNKTGVQWRQLPVENTVQLKLHISKKIKYAFAVLPVRWIVERTFAWLGNFRRLSKDYELFTTSAENRVRITLIQLQLPNAYNF